MNILQEGQMGKSTFITGAKHWDAITFNGHIMMDALAKHLLGLSTLGMTDVGEVLETYCHLKNGDEEVWIDEWRCLASRLKREAEEKEKKGYIASAASLYLRASTYWRVSLMCYGKGNDERVEEYAQHSHDCYEKSLLLSKYPGTFVKIPYEDTYLPGHFYRSPEAGKNAPLLILTPGRDTWAEDTRWVFEGALKRGIHCLTYDGPGQGYALRLQKLPFRPDWENVLTPVIDFALADLKGIDAQRIGVMGFSFGGFLLPRAVAFEKRVKLCITDPGNMDWGTHFADIFTKAMKLPAPLRPKMLHNLMADYAWKHGVEVSEVVEELRKYNNEDILDQITCHMLVLDGTAEINKGCAKGFYDALKNCKKDYKLFDETTTAQCHSQMGGYAYAGEWICDYLAEYL